MLVIPKMLRNILQHRCQLRVERRQALHLVSDVMGVGNLNSAILFRQNLVNPRHLNLPLPLSVTRRTRYIANRSGQINLEGFLTLAFPRMEVLI